MSQIVNMTPEQVWKGERDPSTPQKEPKWICPDDCKNVAKKLDFGLPEQSAPVLLHADTVPLPQTGGYILYRYLMDGRIVYEDSETFMPLMEEIFLLKENLYNHEVWAVVICNDQHNPLLVEKFY